MRSAVVLALPLVALIATSALAQDPNVKDIAFFTGQCRLQIVKGFFPCNPGVAYMHLGNGRSAVLFQRGDASFTLSGGKDRQPNLENYYLSVDTLRLKLGDKPEAVDNGMEGECHFSLNKSGTVFYYVKCDIYNRAKGSLYNFYLEKISKPDHKHFN